MFVANIFYALAICFTKLSIVSSYIYIFDPHGPLKILMYATGAVTTGLGIASLPATIFECLPVYAAWDFTYVDAKCYTFVDFLYASTAISVATDLILCVIPIPLFWRLQLPLRQKLLISALFFLGGLCVGLLLLPPLTDSCSDDQSADDVSKCLCCFHCPSGLSTCAGRPHRCHA